MRLIGIKNRSRCLSCYEESATTVIIGLSFESSLAGGIQPRPMLCQAEARHNT